MNNSPIVNIDSIIFLNGFFVIYIESFNLQTDGTSLLILFSVKDPKKFHQQSFSVIAIPLLEIRQSRIYYAGSLGRWDK